MVKHKHRLTKLNIEAKTAVCESCGPTGIRIRDSRLKNWRCGKGDTARKRGKNKRYNKKREEIRPKPTLCEICLLEKPLCWDHDHRTGKHRGWLCQNCNTALGHFYDDPNNLSRAITYLMNNRMNSKDL